METIYLEELSTEDKVKFHHQGLFDNLREIKIAISIFVLGGAIIESVQNFFFPSDVNNVNNRGSVILIVTYILTCICYYISIFKYFTSKGGKLLKFRYWILFIGIIIYSSGILASAIGTDGFQNFFEDPNKCVYEYIEEYGSTWFMPLIDMIIPIWYMKLLFPLADWIVIIDNYYRKGMPYQEFLWIKCGFGLLYFAYLFRLKAHVQWKAFLKNLNVEKWYEVQKSILNKVPDAIAVIKSDYSVIYSNSSFKTICGDNLKSLGKKISQIKRISPIKPEKDHNENPVFRDGVASSREETNHLFANKESGRLQGNTKLNESFTSLSELLDEIMTSLLAGNINSDEYLVYNGKCESLSYDVKISPILNYKKIIIILSDTTQRDKVITLEAENQHKDRLLATVSHDLRAPLNGSLTFIGNTLEHEAVPLSIKQQFLIPAQRTCQFLLHLVNDILDFSQVNARKLRLTFENKSIIDTINNCYKLLEIQANHKNIAFSLHLDKNMPENFTTDHTRVSQIIINILSNAIKFTFKGQIRLIANAISKSKIEIRVSDTGIGIKAEDQTKLFQDFTRIDYDQPGINTRGVGLGLVIANQLAKMLGPQKEGQAGIKVSSIYGKGSTFWFCLKNKEKKRSSKPKMNSICSLRSESHLQKEFSSEFKSDESRSLPIDTLINLPNMTTFSIRHPDSPTDNNNAFLDQKGKESLKKILIVDDDSFNILALQSLLQKHGLAVEPAFSGEEAVQKVKESKFPSIENKKKILPFKRDRIIEYMLIFMDCEMPVMNGFMSSNILTEMMKKKEIEYIPIIGCTSHNSQEVEQKCKESGMREVITKPITKERLERCLRKYLKR